MEDEEKFIPAMLQDSRKKITMKIDFDFENVTKVIQLMLCFISRNGLICQNCDRFNGETSLKIIEYIVYN